MLLLLLFRAIIISVRYRNSQTKFNKNYHGEYIWALPTIYLFFFMWNDFLRRFAWHNNLKVFSRKYVAVDLI